MSDNDNGCGAAVAEVTASTELAKDFTLFQIEESLVLLAESARRGRAYAGDRAGADRLPGGRDGKTRSRGRLHPLLRRDGGVGQGRRKEAASPAETLRSDRRARERHGAARPGLPRGEEVGGPNEHSQEEEVPALGQDH